MYDNVDVVKAAEEGRRNSQLLGGSSMPSFGSSTGGYKNTYTSSGSDNLNAYGNDMSLTDRFNKGAEMLRGMREPTLPKPDMNGMGRMGQMFSAMGSMMSGTPIDMKMAEKNPFLKFFMGQSGAQPALQDGDPTRLKNDPFATTSAARNLF